MQSTNLKIIFAIIFTAVIVGGGVYLWQYPELKNPVLITEKEGEKMIIDTASVIQNLRIRDLNLQLTDTFILNEEISLIADKVTKITDDSCEQGYVTGNFKLVVRDINSQKEIDQVTLGELTVPAQKSLAVIARSNAYFVTIQQYGSCNGDVYALYALPSTKTPKIRATNFTNGAELFANKNMGIDFAGSPESGSFFLAVDYYDNTVGRNRTDTYNWDGDITFSKD